MARVFTCGFEENDGNAFTPTMWSLLFGTPVYDSTAHSGNFSMLCGATGRYVQRNFQTNYVSGDTYYVEIYFHLADATPSADSMLIRGRSSGGVENWYLEVDTTGVMQVRTPTGSTLGTFVLSNNTWYRAECQVVVGDSGTITCRIFEGESTTQLEPDIIFSGDNLVGVNHGQIHVGWVTGAAATFSPRIDDVAVNDTTGSFENSWIGPQKNCLLQVTGNVTNEWADETIGTEGSSTFDNVDDVPGAPDDATSYNLQTTTLNKIDRLSMSAMPDEVPASATIKCISVYARVGSDQAATANMRLKLWDNLGTPSDGPDINTNSVIWRIITTAEHLVVNGTGKSKSNLNSYNIGYENHTDLVTRNRQVTALWAYVSWTLGGAEEQGGTGGASRSKIRRINLRQF